MKSAACSCEQTALYVVANCPFLKSLSPSPDTPAGVSGEGAGG